jgi:hypothetical protein
MPILPDDPRLKRCGYAKLFGDGGKMDYVIRKHQVLLGRHSKTKQVDVSLEGHKNASREHAYIRYNFQTSEDLLPSPQTDALRPAGRPNATGWLLTRAHPLHLLQTGLRWRCWGRMA